MSTNTTTTLVAIVSCFLALSSFIIISQNMPTDLKLTREHAISIIKASPKVDPNKNTVKDEWLQSAELQYMMINWANYLRTSGSHSRIYVSTSPIGNINPYWLIDYRAPQFHGTYGSYIVDAVTGELMLALEGSGGPAPLPDYSISSIPAYDDDLVFPVRNAISPVLIIPGQPRELILKFTAQPSYDATMPMPVNVKAVPRGFTVTQNATSGTLKTGGSFAIKLVISSSADAPGTNPPPWDSTPPHIEVELSLIGTTYGELIYVHSVS